MLQSSIDIPDADIMNSQSAIENNMLCEFFCFGVHIFP